MKKLHVVTAIVNPCRYSSRERLYKQFEERVLRSGAELTTIEASFGDRPHSITEAGNPHHIQVHTDHELWHKENLLNLAIGRIDAEYIAWVDADVEWMRDDWADETVQQLQHYDVVQMFSHAIDLGPERVGLPLVQSHTGFCFNYLSGKPYTKQAGYEFWHPGFAWAARRSALDKLGGLIDWTLLGAADHIMALALIGKVEDSMASNLNPNYYAMAHRWQALAEAQIKRNIGYVPGLLMHHWHGKKADRKYVERWKILQDSKYDPAVDVMRDASGILRLAGNKPALRDSIREYFRQRNEDSSDI